MSELKVLFYGASDDCVELEGYFDKEYYLGSDGWTGTLVKKDGSRLKLCADYGRDGWELSVTASSHTSSNWTVRYTRRPDRDEDPAIEIEIDEDTTLFVPDPTEG